MLCKEISLKGKDSGSDYGKYQHSECSSECADLAQKSEKESAGESTSLNPREDTSGQ